MRACTRGAQRRQAPLLLSPPPPPPAVQPVGIRVVGTGRKIATAESSYRLHKFLSQSALITGLNAASTPCSQVEASGDNVLNYEARALDLVQSNRRASLTAHPEPSRPAPSCMRLRLQHASRPAHLVPLSHHERPRARAKQLLLRLHAVSPTIVSSVQSTCVALAEHNARDSLPGGLRRPPSLTAWACGGGGEPGRESASCDVVFQISRCIRRHRGAQ
jgi:hypothetical protein